MRMNRMNENEVAEIKLKLRNQAKNVKSKPITTNKHYQPKTKTQKSIRRKIYKYRHLLFKPSYSNFSALVHMTMSRPNTSYIVFQDNQMF